MVHRSRSRSLDRFRSASDEQGFNQGWSGTPSTQIRLERRADLIATRMRDEHGALVLEIGCGRGEMARRLAATQTEMRILAVDSSPKFIGEAMAEAALPNLDFEVLDFTRPEALSGQRFDYIVGNGILHHLYRDLATSLRLMRELLVEGGRLVFLEPNLHNPYVYLIFSKPSLRRLAKLDPEEMAFSKRYARAQLRDAGFANIDIEYRDFLIPGVPEMLIGPVVQLGAIAERLPVVRQLAQSLFIVAQR